MTSEVLRGCIAFINFEYDACSAVTRIEKLKDVKGCFVCNKTKCNTVLPNSTSNLKMDLIFTFIGLLSTRVMII